MSRIDTWTANQWIGPDLPLEFREIPIIHFKDIKAYLHSDDIVIL